MKFTLAIHGAPYASFAHQHGLKICQALVDAGHQIIRVFFFHDAVNIALDSIVAPQDELDLTAAWRELAVPNNIELAVCVANSLKRGVLSASEAQRYDKQAGTLAESFTLVGLGQLIDGIAQADRYIEIPA